MVTERKKNVLRFDEVQDDVNHALKHYCFDHDISLASGARSIGVDKARLSELKKKDVNGDFRFPLSGRLLSLLILGGYVDLEKVNTKIDLKNEKKVQWSQYQRYLKIIKDIEKTKTPTEIEVALEQMKHGK